MFDLKAQAFSFRQAEVPLKSEITKILTLSNTTFLVLNADQNLSLIEADKKHTKKCKL